MVLYGTQVSKLPKGMGGPDGEDWINMLIALGEEVFADQKDWRYLTWAQTTAMVTAEDFTEVLTAITRLSGVAEVDVEAAATFPGSS